jgi:spore germination cell wall hydrolase CwlJ-like protein
MIKWNKIKSLLLGTALVAISSTSVQAATYTVKSGDTLYAIGKTFNTSYSTIMQSNNLSTSNIYIGQKLTVPGTLYTVKSGDSLYLIANKYNIPLSTLRQANNKWIDMIYPGENLIIPSVTLNSIPVNTATNLSYSAADIDLLARLVTAEAQNQPYTAQVAVAAVVINRIKSADFPNSMQSVIYQQASGYYQFTPVENGFINFPATATSKKAVSEALTGSDPSNGALFYFDDSAKSQWLWSRPITVRIGNMIYTK